MKTVFWRFFWLPVAAGALLGLLFRNMGEQSDQTSTQALIAVMLLSLLAEAVCHAGVIICARAFCEKERF